MPNLLYNWNLKSILNPIIKILNGLDESTSDLLNNKGLVILGAKTKKQ